MAGEHITKQGKLVFECFEKNSGKHLRAEDIAEILKVTGNTVSTATIYRQLERLTAGGYIRKFISSPDEPACYQYAGTQKECSNHFHLKCVMCNKLFHVSCEYLEHLDRHINEHHGFVVDNTRTVLYGVCRECKKR